MKILVTYCYKQGIGELVPQKPEEPQMEPYLISEKFHHDNFDDVSYLAAVAKWKALSTLQPIPAEGFTEGWVGTLEEVEIVKQRFIILPHGNQAYWADATNEEFDQSFNRRLVARPLTAAEGERSIEQNRKLFLEALRSGQYKKGTIKSDDNGRPVIESEDDNNGSCACGILTELFGGPKFSVPQAAKSIGITYKECTFIQRELNDSPLSFPEIADAIEKQVFGKAAAAEGEKPQKPEAIKGCHICGGAIVSIRGRYPQSERRMVCPTCLQERLDQIHDLSIENYGRAYKAGSLT